MLRVWAEHRGEGKLQFGIMEERPTFKVIGRPKPKRFQFCPRCANLLTLNDKSDDPNYRMSCPTCPYFVPVTKSLVHSFIPKKIVEDVEEILDASKGDEHRQRTSVVCPDCNHNEAFFTQAQTRSADEPMTTYYSCARCSKNWKD